MENGFIYDILKWIIQKLCLLNLVEWFKKISLLVAPKNATSEEKRMYDRIAADIFIVLKWIFLLLIWCIGSSSLIILIILWYLIVTNVFTYFFHHIWTDEALNTTNFTADRVRRRFLNLLLAISYSNLSFAFLYNIPYRNQFQWQGNIVSVSRSIWFSISNSLAANYDVVKPGTDFANSVAMIQLIIMFTFVTIIISRSIPQTTTK